MKRCVLPSIVLLALCGCQSKLVGLMPLQKTNSWTYQIEPGLQSEVVDVKVTDRIPVGQELGYRLASSWGTTDLSWSGDSLIAAQLGGTRYDPPIVLLANLAPTQRREWKGNIIVAGARKPATGYLVTSVTKALVGTRELTATQSKLIVKTADTEHETLTWFVEGFGIARQEYRRNGLLVNRLTYLSGP